jgi:two-component system OmpR family response regulator
MTDRPAAESRPLPTVLVVDDDHDIRELLDKFLTRQGLRVVTARDGRDMRRALAAERIDLVVLDLMLPGEDGLALCRELRGKSRIPIIILTAVDEPTERVIGLEIGADDYVTKPFEPRELVARIRAVLRRAAEWPAAASPEPAETLVFAGWRLNLRKRQLTGADGLLVPLSTAEFHLLAALAERPQRVLTRQQLLDLAYGRGTDQTDRSVDVQISRLRRKLEADPRAPAIITTVRHEGYLFAPDVQRA